MYLILFEQAIFPWLAYYNNTFESAESDNYCKLLYISNKLSMKRSRKGSCIEYASNICSPGLVVELTKSIPGMFVLIWMNFPSMVTQNNYSNEVLKKSDFFREKKRNVLTCRLRSPAAYKWHDDWIRYSIDVKVLDGVKSSVIKTFTENKLMNIWHSSVSVADLWLEDCVLGQCNPLFNTASILTCSNYVTMTEG